MGGIQKHRGFTAVRRDLNLLNSCHTHRWLIAGGAVGKVPDGVPPRARDVLLAVALILRFRLSLRGTLPLPPFFRDVGHRLQGWTLKFRRGGTPPRTMV